MEKVKKKNKRKRTVVIVILMILLLISCDMRLKTVVYHLDSDKVDEDIRIALITDLHACWYGKNQHTLIEAVDKQKPDIVLLGGDIFDDRLDYDRAEITIKYLAQKYPCYYVTGNHEYWSRDIDTILDIVRSYGITVLSGQCDTIEIRGQKINICGVDDPDAYAYTKDGIEIEKQVKMASLVADKQYFTLLLSHRPELVDIYKQYDFDLVLSGHAHGGQWRIPFIINGLLAANQGLFPDYAGGRYELGETTMIVSRGLARESLPIPRIFNRPELVIVEID